MPLTIAEVKKNLNFIWGKERDLNETYAFEFASSWSCVRSNGGESRRFKLSFDAASCRLWWGQSYFMDPGDLLQKPEKVQWYRASDPKKNRAAFLWKRLREAKALPEVSRAAPKPSGYPVAASRPVQMAERKAPIKGMAWIEKSTKGPSNSLPEVMLDLDQVLVVYKPPHWKVELPSTSKEDGLYLPSWLREKVTGIDPKLFEVESNPAQSGTGFGPLSHRIDQETSGPLLAARTPAAHKHLRQQFHKTEISKRYVCLVHGRVSQAKGLVDANIRTLRTDATTRSEISASGDWAETQFQVIATYGSAYSLLACDIATGRTHQIRVHMQHLGHPLVSDDKYASEQLEKDRSWCPRLFLHCYHLRFKDTRNKEHLVTCSLPGDLKAALSKLGAASDGHSSDLLFEETSWQREVFRVPLSGWRPGTEVQRCVSALLTGKSEPVLLSEINEDPEVRRLLAKENLTAISREWLGKNYEAFEVLNVHDDASISVRLRAVDAGTQLEQQIEVVRSELEEFQRQKHKAIAQEQYLQAGEIKKRCEAAEAELASLMALVGEEEGKQEGHASIKPVVEAFREDVKDEVLFPSLSSGAVPSHRVARRPKAEEVSAAEGDSSPKIICLKDALLSFLDGREGFIAHINEINNDRGLKEVMAAQPKPMMAINKVWLKQHEEDFSLFRASDNEMYVAKTEALKEQKAARAKAGEAKRQPAYQQVIQKADAAAVPLVYEFSSNRAPEETHGTELWFQKFREALQGSTGHTTSELLAKVPLFAAAMGASRPRQQEELLVTFLQNYPQSFKVEKKGFGAERTYLVSLR